jgi:hypothetical protein
MTDGIPNDPPPTVVSPRAGMPTRVMALLAGITVLMLVTPFTLGLSLAAALGVIVVAFIQRRRSRTLTRGRAWVVAAGTAAAAAIVGLAVVALSLSPAQRQRIRAVVQEANQAPPPPPPAWLEQITSGEPGKGGAERTSGDPLADRLAKSRAFQLYFGVLGGGLALLLLGALYGSVGWATAMLLAYGATGRWLPRAPRRVLPGDERTVEATA